MKQDREEWPCREVKERLSKDSSEWIRGDINMQCWRGTALCRGREVQAPRFCSGTVSQDKVIANLLPFGILMYVSTLVGASTHYAMKVPRVQLPFYVLQAFRVWHGQFWTPEWHTEATLSSTLMSISQRPPQPFHLFLLLLVHLTYSHWWTVSAPRICQAADSWLGQQVFAWKAWGPELSPQCPWKTSGCNVCSNNSNAGKVQIEGFLELIG